MHCAMWTRLMLFLMKRLPSGFCEWLCRPAAVLFYGFLSPQRRVVQRNIAALHPHLDAWSRRAMGISLFHQFALTYLDRLRHLHFKTPFSWELPDESLLRQMQGETGGVLVFTAHSGNYDVGAALFAEKFGRPVHIVRVPERTAELQDIREGELRSVEKCQSMLHVHYNTTADAHLGIELCRILQQGEVVAVQGDRVVMDVSSITAVHDDVEFTFPRGPLILAEVTRSPCYPIFLSRTGSCRYRIHVGQPFVKRGEALDAAQLAARWLAVLHPFLLLHTDQWFVFEPVVRRIHEGPGA